MDGCRTACSSWDGWLQDGPCPGRMGVWGHHTEPCRYLSRATLWPFVRGQCYHIWQRCLFPGPGFHRHLSTTPPQRVLPPDCAESPDKRPTNSCVSWQQQRLPMWSCASQHVQAASSLGRSLSPPLGTRGHTWLSAARF